MTRGLTRRAGRSPPDTSGIWKATGPRGASQSGPPRDLGELARCTGARDLLGGCTEGRGGEGRGREGRGRRVLTRPWRLARRAPSRPPWGKSRLYGSVEGRACHEGQASGKATAVGPRTLSLGACRPSKAEPGPWGQLLGAREMSHLLQVCTEGQGGLRSGRGQQRARLQGGIPPAGPMSLCLF